MSADKRGDLTFVLGILLAGPLLVNPQPIALSPSTVADLQNLGISDFRGLVPAGLISWDALATLPGFVALVMGGFLLGFGARYAGAWVYGHLRPKLPH